MSGAGQSKRIQYGPQSVLSKLGSRCKKGFALLLSIDDSYGQTAAKVFVARRKSTPCSSPAVAVGSTTM
jgi:hypothetical protein